MRLMAEPWPLHFPIVPWHGSTLRPTHVDVELYILPLAKPCELVTGKEGDTHLGKLQGIERTLEPVPPIALPEPWQVDMETP